ncbi:hypothetical protein ACFL40_00155 [candidate division KSB1 bacterium]
MSILFYSIYLTFLKLISIVFIIYFIGILVSGCEKNPVNSELEDIFLDKEFIADAFGNSDGTASETEVDDINNYFTSNTDARGLGGFPETYFDKNEIPLSEVINAISGKLYGPFKSEAELRTFKEQALFLWATDRFWIYVFASENNKSNQYRLKYLYKNIGGLDTESGELIPMSVNK